MNRPRDTWGALPQGAGAVAAYGPELFKAIVESTTDAVFAKDLEGRYTLINTAGARFLGRDVHEVLGKTDAELLPAGEAQSTLEADRQVIASGRTVSYEVRDVWRGVEREWLSTKGVLRDAAGRVVGIFGISREISDQRRAEEALRHSERLASMGTLAAGVAHEINNPLAFVSSNLDWLEATLRRETALAEPRRGELLNALADARVGAERVRVIVQNLLTLARCDDAALRPVDVCAAVGSAINMAMTVVRHRARLVRDEVAVPRVLGDEGRLVQVFLNLLVNAAHATPEGAPADQEIRVTTREDGPGRVLVEVRDTGHGIPPEHLERVFEPFFTTKPAGQGTGLGLFITHGIVRSFGGDIAVDSEIGRGTRVRVWLPAACGAAEAAG